MTEIRIKSYDGTREIALIKEAKLEEYYIEKEGVLKTEGNIYIGIIEDVIPGMEAAFVNIGTEKNSFIHLKDLLPKIDESKQKYDENIKITDLIEPKQKILVQVKKDSTKQKGARTSTHLNIPSKYLAFMPNTDIITVSQKIESVEERERLKEIVRSNIIPGNGAVVRTSAEGKTEELLEDVKNVNKKWEAITATLVNPDQTDPVKLYDSHDIVEKMIVDLVNKNIDKIVVNSDQEFQRAQKLKDEYKEMEDVIIEKRPIEEIFFIGDVIKQIDKNNQRKVWLKCGGFIAIDQTEALTAIDVNTGKFTGKKEFSSTVLKVNKEATVEIAKQIKLRDLGGIIIIDYIDMKKIEDKNEIEKLLKDELKKDRAKTQVEGFTKLDLMEMTRKTIYGNHDEIKKENRR